MATYNFSNYPTILLNGDIIASEIPGTYKFSLSPGKYKFTCYGAQGGTVHPTHPGGYGGLAEGIIDLPNGIYNIFALVGGQGNAGTSAAGGYNGGGKGYSSQGRNMTSGGGATEVRFYGTTLYSRVIVAGGGGGGLETNYEFVDDPSVVSAGGLEGKAGAARTSTRNGQGGKLQQGGAKRTDSAYDASKSYYDGSFGQGGTSGTGESDTPQYINGGGGGWYGGGVGGPDGGAGGGSSFINTLDIIHMNYPLCQYGTSYNQTMGGPYFTSPKFETGVREGNGKIEITCLESYLNGIYIKQEDGQWQCAREV